MFISDDLCFCGVLDLCMIRSSMRICSIDCISLISDAPITLYASIVACTTFPSWFTMMIDGEIAYMICSKNAPDAVSRVNVDDISGILDVWSFFSFYWNRSSASVWALCKTVTKGREWSKRGAIWCSASSSCVSYIRFVCEDAVDVVKCLFLTELCLFPPWKSNKRVILKTSIELDLWSKAWDKRNSTLTD